MPFDNIFYRHRVRDSKLGLIKRRISNFLFPFTAKKARKLSESQVKYNDYIRNLPLSIELEYALTDIRISTRHTNEYSYCLENKSNYNSLVEKLTKMGYVVNRRNPRIIDISWKKEQK